MDPTEANSSGPASALAVTLVAHRLTRDGGMERAFVELAEHLLRRGFTVRVISHRSELAPHPNLRVHLVRCPHRPFLIAYPLFAFKGTLATWRHRHGLVHVLGAIVFNRADVATVQFCHHGFDPAAARARGQRQSVVYRTNAWASHLASVVMERLTYRSRHVRWLIPASGGVARELKSSFPIFASRMTVIPNGVDRSSFSRMGQDQADLRRAVRANDKELLAVFVGGDWERKGLRFAIEALVAAPRWRLIVVGEGPVDRYTAVALSLGVQDRVHFMGKTSDPAKYFATGDAFVLPTAYEAFPLVMLEAAACELPLIITRVNGSEEFVRDGVNGFSIERDGDAVASALSRLEEAGPDGRRAMGAQARRDTERYTWERIADAHIALYRDLSAGQDGAVMRVSSLEVSSGHS